MRHHFDSDYGATDLSSKHRAAPTTKPLGDAPNLRIGGNGLGRNERSLDPTTEEFRPYVVAPLASTRSHCFAPCDLTPRRLQQDRHRIDRASRGPRLGR